MAGFIIGSPIIQHSVIIIEIVILLLKFSEWNDPETIPTIHQVRVEKLASTKSQSLVHEGLETA